MDGPVGLSEGVGILPGGFFAKLLEEPCEACDDSGEVVTHTARDMDSGEYDYEYASCPRCA